MEKKTFYRVCHEETHQGLWYHFNGDFSGFIHDRFSFCKNASLAMDFEIDIAGWLSVTETLEQLYQWFPEEDIRELQKHGFYIHSFESDNYKYYELFDHWTINQATGKMIEKIDLSLVTIKS